MLIAGQARIALSLADPNPNSGPDGIEAWIRDLSASAPETRYPAMDRLTAAGLPAVAPLVHAVRVTNPAAAPRYLRVLTDLSLADELTLAVAAEDAIEDLGRMSLKPETAAAVARARDTRRRIAGEKLRALGARVFRGETGVVEVVLNGLPVSDGDLRWIRRFDRLTDLSLEGTRIGDAAMPFLSALSRLEWLNLYRTDVGDPSLAVLAKLPALTHLPIGRTRITDAGLEHIGSMTGLVYLGLRGTRIDGSGLGHLRNLSRLEGLHLGETGVRDAALEPLVSLISLRRLWLHDTPISDAAVPILGRMQALRELFLADTALSDAGLERLCRMIPNCRVITE